MNLLPESAALAVGGGTKPDLGFDPRPRPGQPVPIWHPVFVTDP